MAQILVTDRQGQETIIDIRSGTSLMQAITDEGVGDLLALCGGMCSCATCHVYIDTEYIDRLPHMSEDEVDLIELSVHRLANSRLACQIPMTERWDGMRVQIAPGD